MPCKDRADSKFNIYKSEYEFEMGPYLHLRLQVCGTDQFWQS